MKHVSAEDQIEGLIKEGEPYGIGAHKRRLDTDPLRELDLSFE